MKVLIVDDDPTQLKLLARVISLRARDFSVLTANGGGEAIELLQSKPIDLVLTDLQMPDMNGFELLSWMLTHQPHVPVFTMTAYPNSGSIDRLDELGNLECFTKPLDVPVVLERLTKTLEGGMRGQVHNVGLPSLLQLIEMERKTCTLLVASSGQQGKLFVRDGKLIHAEHDHTRGDEAATEIIGWSSPAVTITASCATRQQTVQQPMGFIIMEALRVRDEHDRDSGKYAADADVDGAPCSIEDRRSVSEFPAPLPSDADAVAIVELETGRIRMSRGRFSKLHQIAELVARVVRHELRAIRQLDENESLNELVLTTTSYWVLVRPLLYESESWALLVFDPEKANIVMERMAMQEFVAELEAWALAAGG